VLTHRGLKGANGLIYLHFSPEESFVAAGFYDLPMPTLTRFREGIATEQKEWLKIEKQIEKSGYELMTEDCLKRLPKGFYQEEVEAVEHALRLKNFVLKLTLTPKQFKQASLVPDILDLAKAASPLFEFGWAKLAKK
jgi:uncharacterized protein (TIGR02453 family)